VLRLQRLARGVFLVQQLEQPIECRDRIVGAALAELDHREQMHARRVRRLLLERVKAVLRRAEGKKGNAASSTEAKQTLTRGKLTLDPLRHECMWDGKPVRLTVTEFLILQSLAQRPGFVKSRDNLMDSAYDDQVYVDDRTIDSHIKRLRKKFKAVDENFDSIETLYGVGYRYKES